MMCFMVGGGIDVVDVCTHQQAGGRGLAAFVQRAGL